MENPKLPIYCQLSFLLKFIQNRPNHKPDSLIESKEEKIWNKFSEMIFQNTKVFIDADYAQIEKNKNETKFLVKQFSESVEIEHVNFDEIRLDLLDIHTIFLVDNDKYRYENYGYVSISIDDLYTNCLISEIEDTHFSFENKLFDGWEELEKYNHPCNFMIISDNYILDNKDLVEENLMKILKHWLPKSIQNGKFQLIIITDNSKDRNQTKYDAEARFKYLEEIINRDDINVKILFNAKTNRFFKQHGRNIITNYFQIYCGQGFSIFKDGVCQISDTFFLKSIINRNTYINILNIEKQCAEIENKAKNIGSQIDTMPDDKEKIISNLLIHS